VLHAACRAGGARPIAATATVAIIGAAPTVLAYHSQADAGRGVRMNGLVAELILWLTTANGPRGGEGALRWAWSRASASPTT
jgi:hypothetical protein